MVLDLAHHALAVLQHLDRGQLLGVGDQWSQLRRINATLIGEVRALVVGIVSSAECLP